MAHDCKKGGEVYILPEYEQKKLWKFISLIAAFSWNDVYTKTDTNDAFSYFHNNLKVMHDQAFPIKKLKKNHHTRKPWLTECLKISIKKNKLYIVNKKHPTVQNEITWNI